MKAKGWILWGVGIAVCVTIALTVLKPMVGRYQARLAEQERTKSEAAKAAVAAARLEEIRSYSEKDINKIISRGSVDEVKEIFEAGVCSDCSQYINYALSYDRYFSSEIIEVILNNSAELKGHLFSKALDAKRYDVAKTILLSGKENLSDCRLEFLKVASSERLSEDDAIQMIDAMRNHKGYHCMEPEILNGFIKQRKLKVVSWLMAGGTKAGKDALWSYVYGENTSVELFNSLLHDGADINHKSREGLTPLEWVLIWHHMADDRVDMWLKAGAKLDESQLMQTKQKLRNAERAHCLELNEKWMRGVTKGLRGEEVPYSEDRPVPGYCNKYLN